MKVLLIHKELQRKKRYKRMGYNEVENVRIGKLIELELDGTATEIDARVKEMCDKLLVNKVIEDYRYEIGEVAGK